MRGKDRFRFESKTEFEEGLRRTIEWYVSNKDRELVAATLAGRLVA